MYAVESDDEWHMIFDCPVFEDLRAARQHLVSSMMAYDMPAFMKHKDQMGVLKHVLACLHEVHQYLDVDHSQDVDIGIREQRDTYDSN